MNLHSLLSMVIASYLPTTSLKQIVILSDSEESYTRCKAAMQSDYARLIRSFVPTHDIIKKFVILSDSEGSSSIGMAAIQGEEDALFLPMTNGKCHISFRGRRFYLLRMTKG